MDYARIYREFIADRKAREPECFSGKTYGQRIRVKSWVDGVFYQNHHITPISLGGGDKADNIVALTFDEHVFAHLLLAKIHGGTQWGGVAMLLSLSRVCGIPTKPRIAVARIAVEQRNLDASDRRMWTREKIIVSARQFETRSAWANGCGSSYGAARSLGIVDECVAHMKTVLKTDWTKEEVMASAARHENLKSWRECDIPALMAAHHNGWYEEATSHFNPLRGFWTFDACLAEARKFKNTTEWNEKSSSSLQMAHRNGWLKEIIKQAGYTGNFKKVMNLDTGELFSSLLEAARKYNMRGTTGISNVIAGRRNTCGGFRWAYAQ